MGDVMPALGALVFFVLLISVVLSKIFGVDIGEGFLMFLDVIALAVIVGILYAIYRYVMSIREPVARWYYFTFHPHPAETIVRDAIADGARPLDGKSLAAAIGEVPPGNAVFRAVRIEQGERLVSMMREASLKRMRAQERADRARSRHALEEAALLGIQEAVGLAGIALERAKAQFEASQRIRI